MLFHEGYAFDIRTNYGWGWTALKNGLSTSYKTQLGGTMIPNYPAFSLMLFEGAVWGYSLFANDITPPESARGGMTEAGRIWIKVPAVFFDLLTTLIIFLILRKLKNDRTALIGAALFAIHPVVWFDSSIWGQTDVIFTLFSLLSLLLMGTHRFVLGGAIAALALMTKFQTVIFFPLFFLLCIRSIWGVPKALIGASIMILLIILPFIMSGTTDDALFVFVRSIPQGQTVSVNAYNFWWALMTDSSQNRADNTWMFGLIPYRIVGFVIVGTLYSYITTRLWNVMQNKKTFKKVTEPLLAAAMLSGGSFYLFMTQMHERYMYPCMLFGLILAILQPAIRIPYAILSFAFFLNLVGVVPFTPMDRMLFNEFESFDGFIASVSVLIFLWIWILTFQTSLSLTKKTSSKRAHAYIQKTHRQKQKI